MARYDPYYTRGFECGAIESINSDGTANIRKSGSPELLSGISLPDSKEYNLGDSVALGIIGGDRNNIGVIFHSPYV